MADTTAHHRPHGGPANLYDSLPPWDIGRPQPAFLRLARDGAITGRVLDAGCGTAGHTLMAAGRGLDATGIDLSATALHIAGRKARERRPTARFPHHDARDLAALGESFGTVLDCGLFHVLGGADRDAYLASLRHVLPPDGRYFMLGISDPGAARAGAGAQADLDRHPGCVRRRMARRLDPAQHDRHHHRPRRRPGLAGRRDPGVKATRGNKETTW